MRRWNSAFSALLVGAACVAGFTGNASAVTNVRTSATTFVSPAKQTLAARSGGVNDRAIIIVGGKGSTVSLNPQPLPPKALGRR